MYNKSKKNVQWFEIRTMYDKFISLTKTRHWFVWCIRNLSLTKRKRKSHFSVNIEIKSKTLSIVSNLFLCWKMNIYPQPFKLKYKLFISTLRSFFWRNGFPNRIQENQLTTPTLIELGRNSDFSRRQQQQKQQKQLNNRSNRRS